MKSNLITVTLLPLQMDLGTFIILMILVLIVVPVLLLATGAVVYYRGKKKTAKILFIIGGVWALISLGVCGIGGI